MSVKTYTRVAVFALASQFAVADAGWTQTGAAPRPVNRHAATLADFSKRIDDYVALHKRLANAVGELDSTKSQMEIAAREKGLGEAIRRARAQAKRGDLFTPEAAAVFRQLIRADFKRHPRATRPETDDRREAESADFRPVINQTYPSTEPLETFSAELLRQLPLLPKEVEYRMVGRSLILRDTEGNVILDFIPEVIG
jgi:hypothetical protein